jgi:hypothetical protein
MGIVYKINLPSGEFYIGCTSQLLKKRLASHLSLNECAKWNVKLFDYGFDLKTLIKNTEILFNGSGFRQKELEFIYDNRGSDEMLNSVIPPVDPRDLDPISDNQKRYKVDRSNRVSMKILLDVEAYKKLISMFGSSQNYGFWISRIIGDYSKRHSSHYDYEFIEEKTNKGEILSCPHIYSSEGKRGGLYRGVRHDGPKYRAIISHNKKKINLGLFDCVHCAARVYNLAARMTKNNKNCYINKIEECNCQEFHK